MTFDAHAIAKDFPILDRTIRDGKRLVYLDSGATNIFGGYVGAKIYTNYQVGFLVELGAGPYGIMNVGVCYKF